MPTCERQTERRLGKNKRKPTHSTIVRESSSSSSSSLFLVEIIWSGRQTDQASVIYDVCDGCDRSLVSVRTSLPVPAVAGLYRRAFNCGTVSRSRPSTLAAAVASNASCRGGEAGGDEENEEEPRWKHSGNDIDGIFNFHVVIKAEHTCTKLLRAYRKDRLH